MLPEDHALGADRAIVLGEWDVMIILLSRLAKIQRDAHGDSVKLKVAGVTPTRVRVVLPKILGMETTVHGVPQIIGANLTIAEIIIIAHHALALLE